MPFTLHARHLAIDRLIGRGLSGAGSSITLDSLTIRASVARTLADLLAARVPGLNVTYSTGALGYAPEITARGATGLFGPGRPLLYVDGVLQREDRHLIGQFIDRQRPSHAWSSPTDEIESVDVVLGPAGGSLLSFGAARGAVMVRTRRPKAVACGSHTADRRARTHCRRAMARLAARPLLPRRQVRAREIRRRRRLRLPVPDLSRYPSGDPETGSFAFPTVQRGDFYTPALPASFSVRLDIAR